MHKSVLNTNVFIGRTGSALKNYDAIQALHVFICTVHAAHSPIESGVLPSPPKATLESLPTAPPKKMLPAQENKHSGHHATKGLLSAEPATQSWEMGQRIVSRCPGPVQWACICS